MNKITYICVASEFNVSELEACLTVCPSDVVLVVSNYEKAQVGAERLKNALESVFPEMTVHRPDQLMSFDGEDIVAVQEWTRQTLGPYLDSSTPLVNQKILNFTGGTKALSFALISNLQCDFLHYKGIGKQGIQVLELNNDQWQSRLPSIQPITATPIQVAKLYADDVSQLKCFSDMSNETSALAVDIWTGLESNDVELLEILKALDQVWTQGRGDPRYEFNTLALPLHVFFRSNSIASESALFDWLRRFSKLHDAFFYINESEIVIPGNKARKTAKYVRRWISGEWLEELVSLWLHQAGIPKEHIARSVVSKSQHSSLSETGRETDLFIHHRGKSYLVEVKVDLSEKMDMRNVEHQLASLGDRFGKTKKVLFIGPLLKDKLTKEEKWNLVKARFSGSGIALAYNQTTLLKAFDLAY